MYALVVVVIQLLGNGLKQLTFILESAEVTELQLEMAIERFLKAILPWGSRIAVAHGSACQFDQLFGASSGVFAALVGAD